MVISGNINFIHGLTQVRARWTIWPPPLRQSNLWLPGFGNELETDAREDKIRRLAWWKRTKTYSICFVCFLFCMCLFVFNDFGCSCSWKSLITARCENTARRSEMSVKNPGDDEKVLEVNHRVAKLLVLFTFPIWKTHSSHWKAQRFLEENHRMLNGYVTVCQRVVFIF